MNPIPRITTRVMMPDPVDVSINRHLAEIDRGETREEYIEQRAAMHAQAVVDDLTGDELSEVVGEMSPKDLDTIANLLTRDPLEASRLMREGVEAYYTEEWRKLSEPA